MMAHKYKGLIIVSIIFIVIALSLIIAYGIWNHWDFVAWLGTPCFTVTVLAVANLVTMWIGFLSINYYNKHLKR